MKATTAKSTRLLGDKSGHLMLWRRSISGMHRAFIEPPPLANGHTVTISRVQSANLRASDIRCNQIAQVDSKEERF